MIDMNKTTFVRRVAQKNQKPQITQRVYDQVLTELLTGIQQELAAGRSVSFLGFGTFYTRVNKGGTALNFKTKQPMEYGAVRVAAFRPGSLLKQAVRRKK
jgi:DNA-binding protein HU-beta